MPTIIFTILLFQSLPRCRFLSHDEDFQDDQCFWSVSISTEMLLPEPLAQCLQSHKRPLKFQSQPRCCFLSHMLLCRFSEQSHGVFQSQQISFFLTHENTGATSVFPISCLSI